MGELQVPKSFMTLLRIPDGPLEGKLVDPCMCGCPIDLHENFYIAQFPDGGMMAMHTHCARASTEDEDA